MWILWLELKVAKSQKYITLTQTSTNVVKSLRSLEHYSAKKKLLRGVILHFFWDWSLSVKLSEIKPPLIEIPNCVTYIKWLWFQPAGFLSWTYLLSSSRLRALYVVRFAKASFSSFFFFFGSKLYSSSIGWPLRRPPLRLCKPYTLWSLVENFNWKWIFTLIHLSWINRLSSKLDYYWVISSGMLSMALCFDFCSTNLV